MSMLHNAGVPVGHVALTHGRRTACATCMRMLVCTVCTVVYVNMYCTVSACTVVSNLCQGHVISKVMHGMQGEACVPLCKWTSFHLQRFATWCGLWVLVPAGGGMISKLCADHMDAWACARGTGLFHLT